MKTIVLLHGALGAQQDLAPLAATLTWQGLAVHSFSFSGHGRQGFAQSFGIPAFTAEVEAYMQTHTPQGAHVFGYSMGGYVALNLALKPGNRIQKVITLGTKFNWSSAVVEKETAGLDPVLMQQKIPAFAAQLEQKHGPDWKDLVTRTADLMREIHAADFLNTASLSSITNKTLLGLGDRDKMVSLEETVAVYKSLPDASLYVLPGTKHPIELVDTGLLSAMILHFMNVAD